MPRSQPQPDASPAPNITQLLQGWRQGDAEALNQLLPLVYDHLRKIANQMLRQERQGHTLNPTALVHEAWFRLRDSEQPQMQDRSHFMALAARQMRHVLVDHARGKLSEKRGGGWNQVTLTGLVSGGSSGADCPLERIAALDLAFEKLERIDPRKAQVAELFLFGGFTGEEVAATMELSTATVNRDWTFARRFLQSEIGY